jgi:hypothetical protein
LVNPFRIQNQYTKISGLPICPKWICRERKQSYAKKFPYLKKKNPRNKPNQVGKRLLQ